MGLLRRIIVEHVNAALELSPAEDVYRVIISCRMIMSRTTYARGRPRVGKPTG